MSFKKKMVKRAIPPTKMMKIADLRAGDFSGVPEDVVGFTTMARKGWATLYIDRSPGQLLISLLCRESKLFDE